MKWLLSIFFYLVVNLIQAQVPAFETGKHVPPEEAKKKKNRYSSLYASNNDLFFVADRINNGNIISIYNNKTLKKAGSFSLMNPTINSKEVDWCNRFFNQDEVTSIYSLYDSKTNLNRVYGNVTHFDNKLVVKEKLLLSFEASKNKDIGDLRIVQSDDKTKFLVYRESLSKDGSNKTTTLWIYDDVLDLMYKKEISFPFPNKQLAVQKYLLTNAGKIFIIVYVEPGIEGKQKVISNNFIIYSVEDESSEIKVIKIPFLGKNVSSAYSSLVDSGAHLVFTGLYCQEDNNRGANGIYYVKINTKLWVNEIVSFKKIPEEELSKIFAGSHYSKSATRKARRFTKNGKGLKNYILKDVFFDSHGNVSIVAELEFFQQRCQENTKTGISLCRYYSFSKKIVSFPLDSTGNLVSTLLIPKKQVIIDRPAVIGLGVITYALSASVISPTIYLGHIALFGPNHSYFIYNDNDKNLNPEKIKQYHRNKFHYVFRDNKKSRLVYCYQSDSLGKSDKKAMTATYKSNIKILSDAEKLRLSDGSMIVWGKVRKSNELILMRFFLRDEDSQE